MPCPTPTPKIGTGAMTGVYDIQVHSNNKAFSAFTCIGRIDHAGGVDVSAAPGQQEAVKSMVMCVVETDLRDPNAVPADLPGEGPVPSAFPGPPPPRPNIIFPAYKGTGQLDCGTDGCGDYNDLLTTSACLSNLGGSLAPNVVAELTIADPMGQMDSNGKITGTVAIHLLQGLNQCNAASAKGSSLIGGEPAPINFTLTDVADSRCARHGGGCIIVPWRPCAIPAPVNGHAPYVCGPSPSDSDWDGDGCDDSDELDKQHANLDCGDDPWNPLDSNQTDLSGSYGILAIPMAADACWNSTSLNDPAGCASLPDGTLVAGFYYVCTADFQQSGKNIAARLLCYTDRPNITVNAEAADGSAGGDPKLCPPAPADRCGDGVAGPSPPGPATKSYRYADVDDRQAQFTGTIVKNASSGRLQIQLSGCYEDRDGKSSQASVYMIATVDALTGTGTAKIFDSLGLSDCQNAVLAGPSPDVPFYIVRQATNDEHRDTDQDGCTDREELSNNAMEGGLRDPLNEFDLYDVTGDGYVDLANDILGVAFRYTPAGGLYDANFDRGGTQGGNPVNQKGPDGVIDLPNDILGVAFQYQTNCQNNLP